MKRVLTVGVTYTGEKIEGVEIENLGLCQAGVDKARAAFPLYEYDTIIINPQSYSHFLFGAEGSSRTSPMSWGSLSARMTATTSIPPSWLTIGKRRWRRRSR
ncbi:hypothetical protein ACFSUK_06860 [Sphingobium scionense]